MTPEPLMPALLNGVAGFFVATISLIVPLTGVLYEDRPSTIRKTPSSGDSHETAAYVFEKRTRRLHGAADFGHCQIDPSCSKSS